MSYRDRTMKVKARALTILAAVLAGGLTLTSCSAGDTQPPAAARPSAPSSALPDDVTVIAPAGPGEEASTGGPESAPEPPSGADFNQSDIAFMQMMVPHHAQALEMSRLAARHARSADVRRLASRIRAAQAPEILAMSSWLTERDVDVPQAGEDHSAYEHGTHGSRRMGGMLTGAQMSELARARGAEFDQLFLLGMISHHRGAVQMASTVAVAGTDIRVSELAADVNAGQLAEIARMRQMLRSS